jgi:hypothetical protein
MVPDSLKTRESIIVEIYKQRKRSEKHTGYGSAIEHRRESKHMIDKTVNFDVRNGPRASSYDSKVQFPLRALKSARFKAGKSGLSER